METSLKQKLPVYIVSFLHSFSQIMLQENTLTGLFFIIGIGFNSPIMLFGACIATFSSLFTAKLLKYDKDEISRGLYGYNAALVGCAIFFFTKPTLLTATVMILASIFSTLIMHLMLKKVRRVLAFTTPFIISTWLAFLFLNSAGVETIAMPFTDYVGNDLHVMLRGIGQVMFQVSWLTGLIFIIGLLFSSFRVTAWVVGASAMAIYVARIFNFSDDLITLGIYSFNASLVVIALNVLYSRRVWPILLAVVITVLLSKAFIITEIPILTAPFVITSWLIIALIRPSHLVIKR